MNLSCSESKPVPWKYFHFPKGSFSPNACNVGIILLLFWIREPKSFQCSPPLMVLIWPWSNIDVGLAHTSASPTTFPENLLFAAESEHVSIYRKTDGSSDSVINSRFPWEEAAGHAEVWRDPGRSGVDVCSIPLFSRCSWSFSQYTLLQWWIIRGQDVLKHLLLFSLRRRELKDPLFLELWKGGPMEGAKGAFCTLVSSISGPGNSWGKSSVALL